MLTGEYQYSVDPKGRINFPAKLREELGMKFIITKGLDNCLFVYSAAEWEKLGERISKLQMSKSRGLQRFFFAGAAEVEPDKQGRVLIPQNLREYASLEKDVVIVGVYSRAEIWNKEKWLQSCEALTADMMADAMDELEF